MKKPGAMPCEYCDGTIEERRVRDDYWSGEELILIEDVPARACDRCGHRYYHADVVSRLERLVAGRSKAKRRLKVPVLKFEAVA